MGKPPPDETAEPATTPVTADSLGTALAGARPSEAALPVAQARVASALFGDARAPTVGRYQIRERLGAGGMGVVHAAYDPELDRAVAIKLVHVPGRSRAAALAEAQALARLAHPNVVPVHDVGLEGETVFIVMELVRGETLRRWAPGRTVDEILAAYRQAGAALAAAHEAGLVHRDFKPDNAVIGSDGRVRVVDFGLACEEADADRARPVAGTLRYVAPEQVAGAPARAAADQYSFAVSLAEALRKDDVSLAPKWVQAVLERGAAADPAARFPSLPALLRALGRDPIRARRRRIGIGALLVLAGAGAFIAGRSTRVPTCTGGEARLEAIWSAREQSAALARIGAVAPAGSLGSPLGSQIQTWAGAWAAGYREACTAHQAGAHSTALFDRRMVCLERARSAFGALRRLVDTATAAQIAGLPLAVNALPDPAQCSDLEALARDVEAPPPTQAAQVALVAARVERALVEIAAGQLESARTQATAAVAEARAIGYRPLLAEALLAQGHATMLTDARADAVPVLDEAARLGFAAGAHAIAIEAWARRAWAAGTTRPDAAVLAGLDVVEALATREPSARFARALLHNNVGGVLLALERPDDARAAFERGLAAARGVTGRGAVELINVGVNLALTTREPARRDQLLGEAEQQFARLLGPTHPHAIEARFIRGARATSFAVALPLLASACAGFELHPGLYARTARCWAELAFVRRERGDVAGALAALERAAAPRAEPPPTLADAKAALALEQGALAEAARQFTALLASGELAWRSGEPYWIALRRAGLELGLGRSLRGLGRLAAAERALTSAVATLSSLARTRDDATILRRLGRARAELALVKAARGDRGPATAALAADAVAWLTAAGAPEDAALAGLTAP